jgi:predicted adenylyl cyclase CyaB
MPVNLELKAKITSPTRIMRALRKMGIPSEMLVQTDTYFRVRKGRLKMRESGEEKAELIFYERNEKKGRRWSNYSILSISDIKGALDLLNQAFGTDVVVRKRRHVYDYRGEARIHLDRVERLGTFIEFEVFRKGDQKRAALVYRELVDAFGIEEKNVIRCSYSDLMRQRRELRTRD